MLRLIGAGGLGMVYEARHQRLGKRVALKTLNDSMATDPNVWERFLREGRAAAKLRHPNVVDVSDVAFEADRPYLVMELLEGEELSALIKRESPLSVQRTVDLLIPIVSALGHAHDCGVVHRDLKPQNVFLSRSPAGLIVPKVVDFGISKLLDDPTVELTSSRALLGSPAYMSPEQAGGAKVIDVRSDQFSLGVIAYECLTGFRPFSGDSLFSLLNSVINYEPPPIHTEGLRVPSELAGVIAKMMSKAPQDRFDSIRAVGAGFLAFASPGVQFAYEKDFTGCERPTLDWAQVNPDTVETTDCISTRPWEDGRERITTTSSHRPMRSSAIIAGVTVVCAAAVMLAGRHPKNASHSYSTDMTGAPASLSTPSNTSQLVNASNESQPIDGAGCEVPTASNTFDVSELDRRAMAPTESLRHLSKQRMRPPPADAPPPNPPERGVNGALILP